MRTYRVFKYQVYFLKPPRNHRYVDQNERNCFSELLNIIPDCPSCSFAQFDYQFCILPHGEIKVKMHKMVNREPIPTKTIFKSNNQNKSKMIKFVKETNGVLVWSKNHR